MIDPAQIKTLLKGAGDIAMRYFLKTAPSIKVDNTYVTDADLFVQDYLKTDLDKICPNYGIVAEEKELRKNPYNCETFFVIDPIDGTASFISGLPVWGIAIGLVDKLRPIGGYFYMPTTGDLFWTSSQGEVFRNDIPVRMRSAIPLHQESVLLTDSTFHKRYRIDPGYPGRVRSFGSTIAHLIYTATGCADAAFIGRVHIWDIAAGLSMLLYNGGTSHYLNDDEFRLSHDLLAGKKLPTPILVGSRKTLPHFRKIIRDNNAFPTASSNKIYD